MIRNDLLVWIDLEMTGLNPGIDTILEIAVFITDNDLAIVAPGPHFVIHHTEKTLEIMKPVVRDLHTASGLLDLVERSKVTMHQAEHEVVEFLSKHCIPSTALLCGNSIWMDKAFLAVHMPKLHDFFHYRIIDVSSLKELILRWYPESSPLKHIRKDDNHRAVDDILESIEELRYYRKNFFK